MRDTYIAILIILFLLGYPGPGTLKAQEDCRLDLSTIQPIVDVHTAEVLEYEWDSTQRMEIMLVDSNRMVIITQDGCMRHRTRFQFEVFRPIENPSEETWIALIEGFIKSLFSQSSSFRELWQPFLESFEQQLYVRGTNRQFDVSLGSQDFICYVQDLPHQNPAIYIERIGFLFKEKIKLPK